MKGVWLFGVDWLSRSEGDLRANRSSTSCHRQPGVAVGVYGYGLEQWGVVKALYFAIVTLTR